MAIVVPKPGDIVDATVFGKPIADEVNRLSPLVTPAAFFKFGKAVTQSHPGGGLVDITYPINNTSKPAGIYNGTVGTIPAGYAGIWVFSNTLVFPNASANSAQAGIYVTGGGGEPSAWFQGPPIAAIPTVINLSCVVAMNVGDTFRVAAYMNAAIAIGGTWNCYFHGALIAPQ